MASKIRKQAVEENIVVGIGTETAEDVYAEMIAKTKGEPSLVPEFEEMGLEQEKEVLPLVPAQPRITARGNLREEGSETANSRKSKSAPVSRRTTSHGNTREDY